VLVREDENVILEHHEEVADFLALAYGVLALIAVDIWVTPQRKECPST
jgi:hypothetical protein